MNISNIRFAAALLASASACLAFTEPKTLYVDASKPAGSGDGLSEATAFHTIQEAIDAASTTETDTILVAPGDYNEGYRDNVFSFTVGGFTVKPRIRVYINRKVKLVATGRRGETVIWGDYGSLSTLEKNGSYEYDGENGNDGSIAYSRDAVQCIVVSSSAAGSVIKGFTLRNGITHQSTLSGYAAGGIFYATRGLNSSAFYAVDCDFENCGGRGAGGMASGTAIGCRFTRCWALNTAKFGAAIYQAYAVNCIFYGNGTRGSGGENTPVAANSGILVNCTFANNYSRNGWRDTRSSPSARYYNCVNYDNERTCEDSGGVATNCVVDFSTSVALSVGEGSTVVSFNQDTAVKTNLCVCPMTGDWRPVAGGLLDGTGVREYLSLDFIPEEYRDCDFYGDKIPAGAPVPIGVVMPSVQPASGALRLRDYKFSVNGNDAAIVNCYIQSAVWPAQVELGASSRDGKAFSHYNLEDLFHCRGKYSTICQLLPQFSAGTAPYNVTMKLTTATLYVGNAEGQSNASDSNSGTSSAPYATIQKALDRIAETGKATLVRVRPGHYSTGSRTDNRGHLARVVVPESITAYVVAEGGPDVTFIHGEPDTDTLENATLPGCGPNAVHCVSAPNNATFFLVGFTLTDSYSFTCDGSDNSGREGAAFSAYFGTYDSSQKAYDCVFTGNHGISSCGYQATFVRCLFTNNVDCGKYGVLGNSLASACIFAKNRTTVSDGSLPTATGTHLYNCTVYEPFAKSTQAAAANNAKVVNTVFAQVGKVVDPASNGTAVGNVIDALSDNITKEGNVHADPRIGGAWGDYRPLAESQVFGAGVASDPYGVSTRKFMMAHIRGDFENRPVVRPDGTVVAGAMTECREYRTAYADAVNGDDGNEGASAGAAKRTLKAAVEAGCDGTIVVKPGRYDSGEMACSGTAVHGGTPSLRCRVIVPKNTTLVSESGPEDTVIVGAAASDSTGDAQGFGRGADALRCVFLESGATLRGFTVTGGRTAVNDSGDYVDDGFGAGILGRSRGTSVENCIVSNNFASCGGGGAYTSFRNCRILDNRAGRYAGVARHSSLYGCYIAGNRGSNPIDAYVNVVNCTFGEGNDNLAGSAAHILQNGGSSSKVWNCVNLSAVSANTMTQNGPDFRNCLFAKEARYSLANQTDVSFEYTLSELRAMFSDGVPLSSSVATVDAGYSGAESLLGETDLAEVRRVMNGRIDVGAYEFDWRTEYSANIPRKAVVREASSGVTLANGRVTLSDGANLVLETTATDRKFVQVALSGEGTLRVYHDGVLIDTRTSSGVVAFEPGIGAQLAFAYESSSGGTAAICRVLGEGGAMMIVR